nr:hypothetical protein [Nitrospiraceae bacterium]
SGFKKIGILRFYPGRSSPTYAEDSVFPRTPLSKSSSLRLSPTSDDEKDFRYYSWLLASYLEIETFPAQSDEGKKILDYGKEKIKELKSKLEKNQSFNLLVQKQKNNLLDKGYWRLCSWRELGLNAGLSKIFAEKFYSHLCCYAHSGCKSVQQVSNVDDAETQKALCVATMKLIMVAMANMIQAYCQLFKKSKSLFQKEESSKKLVDQWIKIGAHL